MVQRRLVLGLLIASVFLAACESDCHTGIYYDVSPQEVVLAVGDSFTPQGRVRGCDGGRPAELLWATGDSTVAVTDRGTGETVGIAPGTTWVGGWDGDSILGNPYVQVTVDVVQP